MLGAGSYFYFNKKQQLTEIVSAPVSHDAKAPVSNRALITLSNGQKVFLDSAANGTLAQQGAIHIIKTVMGKSPTMVKLPSTMQTQKFFTILWIIQGAARSST
jgi:hypothetical protein